MSSGVAVSLLPVPPAALMALRAEVPDGWPERDLDQAARDALGLHALAHAADGRLVGAARLGPDHCIDALAVTPAWRRRGVAGALLGALLRHARETGWAGVSCQPPPGGQAVFERAGLLPSADSPGRWQRRFDGPSAVLTLPAAIAATAAVIGHARSRLLIYTRALDPGLLDQPAVVDALRRFATARHAKQVQVLLQDGRAPQTAAAPLVRLAQRLDSAFSFRLASDPVDASYPSAYLASDSGGYYFRPTGHRFDDGEASLDGPARSRQLQALFAETWARSALWSEFRALGI